MAEFTNDEAGTVVDVPAENGAPTGAPVDTPEAPIDAPEVAEEELTPAQILQRQADAQPEVSESSPANEASKANGKPAVAHVDLSSEEAFPSLGGSTVAPTSAPKWGAKMSLPTQHQSGSPAESWKPAVSVQATQKPKTLWTLQRADRRSELKKELKVIITEIAKKTKTTIVSSSNSQTGATTYLITNIDRFGTEADREKAVKELQRELVAKVEHSIDVPAVIRPFIIGKGGAKIQELQAKTYTSIKVPNTDADVEGQGVEYDDEAMISVTIQGDKMGVLAAEELIRKIVKERVIKVTREITTSPKFYPFLQGPNKSNQELLEETVDKVTIPDYYTTQTPPPNFSPAGPIEVTGEKSAVEKVIATLNNQIHTLEAADYPTRGVDVGRFQTLVFTRDNGKLIKELFASTGCSIIAPPLGVDRLYVTGPSDRLTEAVSAVFKKTEEYKTITLDLCKAYVGAPAGAKAHAIHVVRHARSKSAVQKLVRECDVTIAYPADEDLYDLGKPCYITIIGESKESLDSAVARFRTIFGSYTPQRVAFMEVEPIHIQRHVKGKPAEEIFKSTSVELLIPDDKEDNQVVLFYEGESNDADEITEALEKAKKEINEITKDLVQIVTKVLKVPQELHAKIRGENDTVINALNPSSISVRFGAPKASPGKVAPAAEEGAEDTITLRGPPNGVGATAVAIEKFLEATKGQKSPEIVNEPIYYNKAFSGNLIGTKGANINKLRDDFGVHVKLNEGNGEIRGIQVCVDAARKRLVAHIKELEDKATVSIRVPRQFHSIIIGPGGKTVKKLEERYNVRINFPKATSSEENGSKQAEDEIIVRGNKKGVEDARKEINDIWKYEDENGVTSTVTVKASAVGYMFKNASKDIKQLRDSSSAKIIIPAENKENAPAPDSTVEIKIRGTKEEVANAKAILTKIAKQAENTTVKTIKVDKKFHKSLIGTGGNNLMNIVVAAVGPTDRQTLSRLVRFPNQNSDSDEITVQGNTEAVDKIVEAIQKVVAEKESQISELVVVAPEKHRKLIGHNGSIRKEIETKFAVTLDIPRQTPGQQQTNPNIKITGLPTAVEAAKAHILELVTEPEGVTVEVPSYLHHLIADGRFFKTLQRLNVTIDHNNKRKPARPVDPTPKGPTNTPLITDEPSDEIIHWEIAEREASEDETTFPWVIRGAPENVEKAKTLIEEAVSNARDQTYTGFLILPDPSKYRFIVGTGGATVDRIRKQTQCRINVPREQSVGNAIVIQGSKEQIEKAKDAVLEAVRAGSSNERSGRD